MLPFPLPPRGPGAPVSSADTGTACSQPHAPRALLQHPLGQEAETSLVFLHSQPWRARGANPGACLQAARF